MIVDIHTHVFPEKLAARALEELSARAHITPQTDGTCAGLHASMTRAKIDMAAIMPVATKPDQVARINSWAVETNLRHLDLVSFGSLHPDMDDPQGEIKSLVSAKIPGVKLHPDYQEFFVDDERMFSLYAALANAGLIVLFHAGIDIGLPFPTHCTPERLAKVVKEFSDLTIIAAHMGGFRQWDAVDRHLVGRRIYLDTSYSLEHLGASRMAEMINLHGAERVLFGSDSPWTNQTTEVEGIMNLDLTDEQKDAVLGTNALKLLGRL